MRVLTTVLIVCLLVSACGGSGSTSIPTAPTSTATTDLAGTWLLPGGDLTWRLTQSGNSVTGTSAFSQGSGQFLGAVSGQGAITGTVANGVFAFTDVYSSLSRDGCSMRVSGSLTIAGSSTMNGSYVETDTCNGAVLGTVNGSLSMRKQ